MSRAFFRPKFVGEVATIVFDFSSELQAGETISTAVCTDSVYIGTADAVSMIDGSATINGSIVSQLINNGTVGNIYVLSCAIVTSGGNTLVMEGYVAAPSQVVALAPFPSVPPTPAPTPGPTPAPTPAPSASNYYTQSAAAGTTWPFVAIPPAVYANKMLTAHTSGANFGLALWGPTGANTWKKKFPNAIASDGTFTSFGGMCPDGVGGYHVLMNYTKTTGSQKGLFYIYFDSFGNAPHYTFLGIAGKNISLSAVAPRVLVSFYNSLLFITLNETDGTYLVWNWTPPTTLTQTTGHYLSFGIGALVSRTLYGFATIGKHLYLSFADDTGAGVKLGLMQMSISSSTTAPVAIGQIKNYYALSLTGGMGTSAWISPYGSFLGFVAPSGAAVPTAICMLISTTTGAVSMATKIAGFNGATPVPFTPSSSPSSDGTYMYMPATYVKTAGHNWPTWLAMDPNTNSVIWGNSGDTTAWGATAAVPYAQVGAGQLYTITSAAGLMASLPTTGGHVPATFTVPAGAVAYKDNTASLISTVVTGNIVTSTWSVSSPGQGSSASILPFAPTVTAITDAVINPNPPTNF